MELTRVEKIAKRKKARRRRRIQNTISIKANADNVEQMPTNEKHDVILNNPYNEVHYDSPSDMQNTETQTDQPNDSVAGINANIVCRNANIIGTNDNVIDQFQMFIICCNN